MLLPIDFWARLIAVQYPVPNVAWMKLVIDFTALRCILIIELVEGELLYTED